MTISYWGVEHGESISKAEPMKPKKPQTAQPSAGRRFLASAFPAPHAAIAGRKGKKLRATGNATVGTIAGGYGGALAGAGMGALLSRGKNPAALSSGAIGGAYAGGVGGSQMALNRNQRKGYMKKEPR